MNDDGNPYAPPVPVRDEGSQIPRNAFRLPLVLSILPGISVVLSLVFFGWLSYVVNFIYTGKLQGREEEILWFCYCIAFVIGFCGLFFRKKWALWLLTMVWCCSLYRHHDIVFQLLAHEHRVEKLRIWIPVYLAVNIYECLLLLSCLRGLWLCRSGAKDQFKDTLE